MPYHSFNTVLVCDLNIYIHVLDHLGCLKWLTAHQDYTPNEKTVHGATPVYFAAQEGR